MKSARALSGMCAVKEVFLKPEDEAAGPANEILDHFHKALEADVCYLMDSEGYTVASSNRNDPDSFVGENYGFRPYFKQAMEGLLPPGTWHRVSTSMRRLLSPQPPRIHPGRPGLPPRSAGHQGADRPHRAGVSPDPGGNGRPGRPGGLIFISNRSGLALPFPLEAKAGGRKKDRSFPPFSGRALFSGPVSIEDSRIEPGTITAETLPSTRRFLKSTQAGPSSTLRIPRRSPGRSPSDSSGSPDWSFWASVVVGRRRFPLQEGQHADPPAPRGRTLSCSPRKRSPGIRENWRSGSGSNRRTEEAFGRAL